ncbi:MAG: RDD family protein [Campylobacterota bacterium]|nr:RDD family protein [Campylobacterota bacterium]
MMRFRDIKKKKTSVEKKVKPKYIYPKITDRIKAFITDMFMIYMPIMYVVTYLVFNGKDDFLSSGLAPFLGTLVYGLIYGVLISKWGQTPGKKAYMLKVVDAKSGEHIGFFRALFRFLAFLFTATTLLGLFMPYFRKDKKTLHDLMSRSMVVGVKG